MLSLTELESKIPAPAATSVLARELYEDMAARFDALGIDLDADTELMVSNHILCLAKRIETGEFVDLLDEALFSEVSQSARDKSRSFMEPAFERCERPVDSTEMLMMATHIEVALAKMARAAGETA